MFVGSERTSTIMIYSFEGNSTTPDFESIHRSGGSNESFTDLYEARNIGDIDPEDLR